jgi:hypothetical protein
MNMPIKARQDENSGIEKFCKMIMNSTYGKDLLNSELFSKISKPRDKSLQTSIPLRRLEKRFEIDIW